MTGGFTSPARHHSFNLLNIHAAASGSSPADDDQNSLTFLSRQALAWDGHPALSILSRQTFALDRVVPQAASGRGESDKLSEQLIDDALRGEEIRLSLGALWPTVDSWLTQSDAVLKSNSISDLEARRLRVETAP